MITHTSVRPRPAWKDTRAVTTKVTVRTTRATQSEAPQPAAPAQLEKEAERWVAEMMFNHYNG